MARYKADGADVAVTVYPGAPHGFDAGGAMLTYLPNVLNGAACRLVLTRIDDAPNGADLGCITRGATSGYHGGATANARRIVRTQLSELLARPNQGFGMTARPAMRPLWRLHPEE